MASIPDYKLPGSMVRRLMRKHGVTIRTIAQKYHITMKRVREVRQDGARGFAASEWHFMITGVWLDGLRDISTADNCL
jgi:hypothetical protein